jgi:short-subunit dehydrogenase
MATEQKFAVVTGASSGIGFELARCCAEHGYELLIAADEPQIQDAAAKLRDFGNKVEAIEADLSTKDGIDKLVAAIGNRPVGALLANAGRGLGRGFLDQDFEQVRLVIETNVTGTLDLIQRVARGMRDRKAGRILITGSIAGFMPGTYQAVYNGTKALLDSFAYALRAELKDTGVSVTCLMPGATETEFFERADMLDTKVGTQKKQPPEEVAKAGFKAMLAGDGEVVAGWQNKLRAAISHITPSGLLAEQHRAMAEPGSAQSHK